jgi:hypothetical protein
MTPLHNRRRNVSLYAPNWGQVHAIGGYRTRLASREFILIQIFLKREANREKSVTNLRERIAASKRAIFASDVELRRVAGQCGFGFDLPNLFRSFVGCARSPALKGSLFSACRATTATIV